ncbi:MAG: DNA starvation/stationary phase protection protein [Saprospiraceae bacterium]|jgi:starvation-inducible DNA-binding protein
MNYLGIDKKRSTETVKQLNQLLANYHVYYQNLRNFHWNINGENFFDLHVQFEALYSDARLKIDEIAERILTLRHRPTSNMSEYLQASKIKEAGNVAIDREMVGVVLENHAKLISCMRDVLKAAEELGDEGTIDMVAGFLSALEKKSWMLDAWHTRKIEPVPVQSN